MQKHARLKASSAPKGVATCGDGGMSFMVRGGAVRFGIDPRRAQYQAPELALRFTDTDKSLSGDSIVVCAVAETQSHILGCSVDSHSVRQRTDAGDALRAIYQDGY